jgi:hypothetical protein
LKRSTRVPTQITCLIVKERLQLSLQAEAEL